MSKVITSRPHGNGTTRVAFSKDGSRVFSGGADSLVRIWDAEQAAGQEPKTAAEADDPITWIATAEDCWLSSSEDGEVRRYTKYTNAFDAPVTSTSGGVAIRSISIDPEARKVAVASDELSIKIVDLEDTLKATKLEGYTSPVRAVTWSPSGQFLTTCTQDGKIVIWNMTEDPPKREKIIDGVIPVVKDDKAPEFSYDCSVVWHTSGQHFYVASKGHDIVTISRSDWSPVAGSFSHKDAVGAITALALSPNGVYLVSACKATVFVWSTQTRRVISSHAGSPGAIITQIAFCPRRNLIAWADSEGGFTRWQDPVPSSLPDPVKISIGTKAGASSTVNRKPDVDLFAEDAFGKDDAMDDIAANLGELDDDEDMLDIDKDWIVDDMEGALNDEPAPVAGKANGYVKEMVSITKAQPPFQPGSTPFQNKKRYLAYNMLGTIEAIDQDIHQVINVSFFNKSARSSFHFTDLFKNDMGYLGDCGAVFACPAEENHEARVLFKPYSPLAQEWTYILRSDTRVLGIAAGGLAPSTFQGNNNIDLQGLGHVVVATDENDLTFLTGTGRERRVMALPGDFVTMIAAPEWVLVVYRPGSTTIDGSQNLYYVVINFDDFSVRQRDVLPVPKGHTLKWLGLTEEGLPAMYDSKGYLSVLTKVRIPHHAAWVRIIDTNLLERRKGKDESYWPVGVSDSTFMCLILKGNQEHPGFPRPLIQELEIRLPFRQSDDHEESVERGLLHTQTLLDSLDDDLTTDDIQGRELKIDKELLILIQGACKSGNVARAIELVKLLHNIQSYDAAISIAEFNKLLTFKEKAQALKDMKEEEEDRLVALRNKRKRWLKPDQPLRQLASGSGLNGGLRYDPLSDTRPPPQFERPGMSRVTKPVIEKTRFTSAAAASQASTVGSSGLPWDDQPGCADSPPPAEKRKRDEIEESWAVPDTSMPPPKTTKGNPFARKAGQETNRNPFARSVEKQNSLHKSESFFEKVEATESASSKKRTTGFKGKDKEKEKEKKEVSKQPTLFNMLPKKAPKPKATAAAVDSQETVETQDDVTMSDATAFETQTSGGSVPNSDWEETQLVDDETQEA